MGFFGRASVRGGWLLGGAIGLAAACGGGKQQPVATAADDDSAPPACLQDEVREYFCDNLLPLVSEKPAPDPYGTCPGSVGVKGNVFPATSTLARFDVTRTELTRKRAPPGHACCYSWCSKLKLAEPADVDAAACQHPNAMREKLCISVAEAGVSDAAAAPYDQCAGAVAPPAGVAFSAPKAAALDLGATGERRSQGLQECCYGWCSQAPLGTGLGPK